MNPSDITVDQVIAALEKAVQIKGADYVYPNEYCVYAIDNQPACIVGHVFDKFGILDRVQENGDVAEVNEEWQLFLSNDVVNVLSVAQKAQDGDETNPIDFIPRKTWGEALDLARRVAKDLDENP